MASLTAISGQGPKEMPYRRCLWMIWSDSSVQEEALDEAELWVYTVRLRMVCNYGDGSLPELGFRETKRRARVRKKNEDLGFPTAAGNPI
jgi:hypothetical protein